MALVLDAVVQALRVISELLLFAGPLWVAALVGLLVGWAWKPRWAAGIARGEEASSGGSASAPSLPFLDFRRLLSIFTWLFPDGESREEEMSSLSLPELRSDNLAVTEKDLLHLSQLVELRDGGSEWHPMMKRSLPNMSYQAWRRDPEIGPPQYRSRTVFEDATPEIIRDFFWDDQFRLKNGWDDMLIHHETLEECPVTGTLVIHWIRKFPFFCSDREYTIGRRIWKLGRTYYCVTKGVPWPSLPRRKRPRRVDLYYSSWCIRQVESMSGDGQLTACEVLLFHYEDMGIPWEIAKLGVRRGMWSCVKRIEPGLRAYQIFRMSDETLSHSALMAQINSKITDNYLRSLERNVDASEIMEVGEKPSVRNVRKFLVLGGVVALACTLDRGLLTKAVLFGVARRFIRTRTRS